MSAMKITDSVKHELDKLKQLTGLKSYSSVVALLVEKETYKYCWTVDGYADIGMNLQLDDGVYQIIDMTEELVYARKGSVVTEFHKRGKVAWKARIINAK